MASAGCLLPKESAASDHSKMVLGETSAPPKCGIGRVLPSGQPCGDLPSANPPYVSAPDERATRKPKKISCAARTRTFDSFVQRRRGVLLEPLYQGIRTGDIVEFTFRGGEVLTGRIARINAKQITIEDVNSPSYPRGVYCNPSSILRKVGAPDQTAPTSPYKIGQPVRFMDKTMDADRKLIDAETVGVVSRVSDATCEVYGGGMWGGSRELRVDQILGAAPRRDEQTILKAISGVYGRMSPENLSCDGEGSRSHMQRTRSMCTRALRALQTELGRKVDESEAFSAVYGN